MIDKYADIIDFPHPTSKRHPRMSMLERAAQFAPFAALTGYGDVIDAAARKVNADPVIPREEFPETGNPSD
jgi:hypothetical protein